MKNYIKEVKIDTAEELFRELSVTVKYKELIGNYFLVFLEREVYNFYFLMKKEEEHSLEKFHFSRLIKE